MYFQALSLSILNSNIFILILLNVFLKKFGYMKKVLLLCDEIILLI